MTTGPRIGVRHRLAVILGIAALATLRGATSLDAIGEVAAELEEEALCRLSCRISPSKGTYVAPEESTIRRTLKAVDADAVDLVVNAWIADQVAAGRLSTEQAPLVELAAMVEQDDDRADNDRGDRGDGRALLRRSRSTAGRFGARGSMPARQSTCCLR